MASHMDLIAANFTLRSKLAGEIREIASAATEENRALTEDETSSIEAKRGELNAADERIAQSLELGESEQRTVSGIESMLGAAVDRDRGQVLDTRSLGERFAAADGLRSYVDQPNGSFAVAFPGTSLRAVTSLDSSSNPLGGTQTLARIGQDVLDRRVFLADLLPHIPTSTGVVEYVQDSTTSGGYDAAEQTEGSAKSEKSPDLDVITESAATVASFVKVTRQAAEDFGQLMGYLDGRLRYGLRRRVDGQIVSGNGTAPNLKGLGNRTGIGTYTASAIEEAAVSVRKAITISEQNESVPEIAVVNPADAEKIDLLNVSSSGLHSTPDAVMGLPVTAWGLTRVVSNAVASGTALLIDPMQVAILDRNQPTAYLTDADGTDFTKNILTLLLEVRLGLALFSPKGVTKVTFKYA